MIGSRNLVPWSLALLVLLCTGLTAEVVDRTIAVVNNHLLTWSDLDAQMRFEALENRRALKDLGAADRREAFDHLVQYRILRDQMQGTAPATAAEVDARIGELRVLWQMDKSEIEWTSTLDRYGLSPVEVRELVKNQIEVLKFMEFRVRPLARVSRREVEDYYTNVLLPQVMARGQTPDSIESMTPKIRELLIEQKVNQEMDKLLQGLRAQSSVQLIWEGVR